MNKNINLNQFVSNFVSLILFNLFDASLFVKFCRIIFIQLFQNQQNTIRKKNDVISNVDICIKFAFSRLFFDSSFFCDTHFLI